jgi:cytochrome c nitrite reductase small subunit
MPAATVSATPLPSSSSAPPRRWLRRAWLALSLTLGLLLGVGGFTFRYAEGASYLRTAPEACVNCHIMQPQYDGWVKSPHHAVAVCVDCHLPDAFVPKYLTKAENGWRHGKLFTTQTFKEPIEVGSAGARILQANCVRCHEALVASMFGHGEAGAPVPDRGLCVHCHADVGHGERAGLGGPLRRAELRVPSASKTPPMRSAP